MPSLKKIASYHCPSTSPMGKGQSWFPAPARQRVHPSHSEAQIQAKAKLTMGGTNVPTLPDLPQPPRTQSGQQWTFLHTLLAQDDAQLGRGSDRNDVTNNTSNSATNDSRVSGDCDVGSGSITVAGNVTKTGELPSRSIPSQDSGLKTDRKERATRILRDSASPSYRGHTSGTTSVTSRSRDPRLGKSDGREQFDNHHFPSRIKLAGESEITGCTDKEDANTEQSHLTHRSNKHNERLADDVSLKLRTHVRSRPAVVANSVNMVHSGTISDCSPQRQKLTEELPSTLSSRQDVRGKVSHDLRPGKVSRHGGIIDETARESGSHNVVNHWTTCRALEDSGDEEYDDTDDDNNNDDAAPRHPEAQSDEAPPKNDESSSPPADARIFSRTTSCASNLAAGRRKRPLLLPPIMLPPIYSVQPTPLVLRDEVYFASVGARARRPLTDDEWDKLKDCRYLRIRTLKRHLKV
ncbi:uncharacterized protein [Littorina saxatilis]|uniref:uncharacterized protein n=1 Tax=Littorina saxatilis TaxID=31220 RepID=UPI0038B5349A